MFRCKYLFKAFRRIEANNFLNHIKHNSINKVRFARQKIICSESYLMLNGYSEELLT